jgi:AcrR family transcriptional regulator
LTDWRELVIYSLVRAEKEKALAGEHVRVGRTRVADNERSKRQERAERILDAAAELIQRWGYKKTAVDDIARLAGVAKGTIYLHWKTREDLFAALLLRESVETLRGMQELIERDPAGMYLSNISKHTMYVILTRPLARALYIRDVSVLGELLQSGQEDLGIISQQKMLTNREIFTLYRERGLLRADQSVTAQIKICSAIVVGFMSMDQYLPAELHSSPEETTELLAAAIHSAVEPAEPVAPEVLQELRATWERVFQQFLRLLEERLQKEVE